MVFLPVQAAPTWLKIVVCIVGYLVWDTAYTVVNVPYGSMATVMTTDIKERSTLSMARTFGAGIGQLAGVVCIVLKQ